MKGFLLGNITIIFQSFLTIRPKADTEEIQIRLIIQDFELSASSFSAAAGIFLALLFLSVILSLHIRAALV